MEYTKGFAIQTPSGEHVGFVLAAPTFNAQSGDCVFMLMPKDPGLVESPLGIVISERKVAGEHHWEKRGAKFGFVSMESSSWELLRRGSCVTWREKY